MSRIHLLLLGLVAMGVIAAPVGARTEVAVFNFEMATATPEWKWLEKGIADRVITDLHHSPDVTVIQRDRMQEVAEEIEWAPEMTSNRRAMERLKRHLVRPDYLVSGVYGVEGGTLSLTAVVIDFKTYQEVKRCEVRGVPEKALELTRQLSATLLGKLSGQPFEKILSELPVWTRSIPAAKALYNGVHLYDQGRYDEAWLQFRKAAREDKAYIEAFYWQGRMYYFMNRYAHARLGYEQFVQIDESHPRLGDAIKEYLHVRETLGIEPDELLSIHDDLLSRFPEALIHNELDLNKPVTARAWLRVRSAQVLSEMGRHEEGAVLAARALAEIETQGADWRSLGRGGWANRIMMTCVQAHNMLTGEVIAPEDLLAQCGKRADDEIVSIRFQPEGQETVRRWREPKQVRWKGSKSGNRYYTDYRSYHFVLAPDGYVFRNLHFYPIITGTDGKVNCALSKDVWGDADPDFDWGNDPNESKDPNEFRGDPNNVTFEGERTVEGGRRDGFRFEDLPRGGIFQVRFRIWAKDGRRDPKLQFHGVRAVAELEAIDPNHGSIHVTGLNTQEFRVRVDGRRGRTGNGLVGLLPPGEHRLSFHSADTEFHRGDYETTIVVEPGRTTRVAGVLPWKKTSPMASWTAGALVGQGYPGANPWLQNSDSPPSILADKEAIRVFWAHRGDLWVAKSTDGKQFEPPQRLDLPISSGWIERDPLCIRDESGRFLLAFRSDRGVGHKQRAYLCWSRDGVHWSRPTMVVDREVDEFDLIQDDKGRFIWVDAADKKLTILSSRNAVRWERLATMPFRYGAREARILQREDGVYELYATNLNWYRRYGRWHQELLIWRSLSTDAAKWSKRDIINGAHQGGHVNLSPVRKNGQTLVAQFNAPGIPLLHYYRMRSDGGWAYAPRAYRGLSGVTTKAASLQYHPRWGLLLAWYVPFDWCFPKQAAGPYLIWGGSVEQVFEDQLFLPAGREAWRRWARP